MTYKQLAEELTTKLMEIDDCCLYCAFLPKEKTFCDYYNDYNGLVPAKICCAGIKKFEEQARATK